MHNTELVEHVPGIRQDLESEVIEKVEQFEKSFVSNFFGEIKNVNKEAKLENVAIFVDYDNVYWTLKNNHLHNPDHHDDDKNLFLKLWEKYDPDKIRVFKAYADFQQIEADLTSLQKKRIQIKHVYANGKKEEHRKNSSDIELCLDAIETTYKDPNITCYVFVTADSDMIPIMSRLMFKGKRVELYYLESAISQNAYNITTYAHSSFDLVEFLNIPVKVYKVENYVLGALRYVQNWTDKFQDRKDRFLGLSWLSTELMKDQKIPRDTTSELIEYLETQNLIEQAAKDYIDKDGVSTTKMSYKLSSQGKNYLVQFEEQIAATVKS